MANKNEPTSPADFFSGGGNLFENLRKEEEMKKLAAAKAAPQPPGSQKPDMNDQPRPGLPAARPSAPLTPVREVAAGTAPSDKQVQGSVDLRPPITASPLGDVTNKVIEFVRRQMTPEEAKQPIVGNRDPEKLKDKRKVYEEFAKGFSGK